MTLGLALGAGGARGWCHVGVLRVMQAEGLEPDVIAGSSMGALVAAAWAAGKLDALEDWGRALTPLSVLGKLDPRMRQGGLLAGQAIGELLEEIGLPDRIEDLDKPFIAVATDMETGREMWLREGPLLDAVRASVAIPGVLSAHKVGACWMLDGGLINPVPVTAARALGAGKIISVNPNARHGKPLWDGQPAVPEVEQPGHPPWAAALPEAVRDLLPSMAQKDRAPGYLDVISVTADLLTEFVRQVREASDPADLVLEANLSELSVLELYRAAEAIDDGKRIARDALDGMKALSAHRA